MFALWWWDVSWGMLQDSLVRLPPINLPWEFGVPVIENFIPASMVWDAIATKHDL